MSIETITIKTERESEILGRHPQELSFIEKKANNYKKKLQELSLEGMPEYLKQLYKITDYFGITSPDMRFRKMLNQTEINCATQKMLVQEFDSKINEYEMLIVEKEQELSDSELCLEKRKSQIESIKTKIDALVEEKNNYLMSVKEYKRDDSFIQKLNNEIIEAKHNLRVYEREKEIFETNIVECYNIIKESESMIVSCEIKRSQHQKSYIASRLEICRLKSLLSTADTPIETIESIVENEKLLNHTEKIADNLARWSYDIDSNISDISVKVRKRKKIYEPLIKKKNSSANEISEMALKIIEERKKSG
ncbi:MAG: hypothetical protein QXG86_02880 [Candidatus Woesearchaeota archaeon]